VIDRIPKRYYDILLRTIEPLIATKNVMAVGLAGSLARGDYWDGSDLDLDVIIKGELPYTVLLKFKEIEIDIAYFNESQYDNLPYDLVPIYDPKNIINDILMNREQKVMKSNIINESIIQSQGYLVKAKTFLDNYQIYSYISNIHLAAEEIATAFILLNGEDPTLRRTISRLEKDALYLQKKGFDVLGIDISPLSISFVSVTSSAFSNTKLRC
jgi:predicted nucleotidyltransferase